MRPRFTIVAATCGALLLGCAVVHAQGPVTRALQIVEDRAADRLKRAAEAMPEARFAFTPAPRQMTFGALVLQLAGENFFLCSSIGGIALPAQHLLTAIDPKDLLVTRLNESFDLCNAVLEHADDSFLEDSIPYFGGRKTNRAAALVELAYTWAAHYSQLAIYLRLNGLEPPTAKRKSR
jgi:hypothetical protein